MPSDASPQTILHASTVAVDGRAVLILGPSGSGKSALALTLMAMGTDLVSDDRTVIEARDGTVRARAPDTIRGKIEARGVGVLAARAVPEAAVVLAVDLERTETERLPPSRSVTLEGVSVDLLHKVESGHFAPAILQYLKNGRLDP